MAGKKIGQIVNEATYSKSRDYFKEQAEYHRENYINYNTSYEKYLMAISTSFLFISLQYFSKINNTPYLIKLLKFSWILLILSIVLNLLITYVYSSFAFEHYTYYDYIYRIKIMKNEIDKNEEMNNNRIIHSNKIRRYAFISKCLTTLRICSFSTSLILTLIYMIKNT